MTFAPSAWRGQRRQPVPPILYFDRPLSWWVVEILTVTVLIFAFVALVTFAAQVAPERFS